jgi:hypothetical protein
VVITRLTLLIALPLSLLLSGNSNIYMAKR